MIVKPMPRWLDTIKQRGDRARPAEQIREEVDAAQASLRLDDQSASQTTTLSLDRRGRERTAVGKASGRNGAAQPRPMSCATARCEDE